MASLKTGLVGAGVFGGYHAGKCAAHSRVNFVGVYDTDYARAQALAAKHDVSAFNSYAEFLSQIDAVIIAAPIGLMFDGTPLPMAWGELLMVCLALWLTTMIRRPGEE